MKQIYLTQFQHSKRETRTVTDLVCFSVIQGRLVPDERHCVKGQPHLIQVCPLGLKPHERAIITGFDLVYALNDFDIELDFYVEPMFSVDPSTPYNPDDLVVEDVETGERHPDETGGTPMFRVPQRGSDGIVHPDLQCIYKPRYMDLGFNVPAYAGLEHSILNANSTCLTDQGMDRGYIAYMPTDPLMVFILQNRHLFKELRDTDLCLCKTEMGIVHLVKRSFVERVQAFFKDTLFPLFHYTTNDYVRFAWKTQPTTQHTQCTHPIVSIMFQLDFIVVSPHVPNVKTRQIKLKF